MLGSGPVSAVMVTSIYVRSDQGERGRERRDAVERERGRGRRRGDGIEMRPEGLFNREWREVIVMMMMMIGDNPILCDS